MMPRDPNDSPLDWYWLSKDGRIYSSGRNALVYPYDTLYLTFKNAHGGTTPWPIDTGGLQTAAALQDVVAQYGITLPFKD